MTPREWQQARRTEGRCPRCGVVVKTINPRTGKAFWRCDHCRAEQRQQMRTQYQQKKASAA